MAKPDEEFDLKPDEEFDLQPEPTTKQAEPQSRLSKLADAITSTADKVRNAPLRFLLNPEAEMGPAGPTGAALRGFGHGASFGFTDELRGASGAMDELGARMSPFERRRLDQTRPTSSFVDALKGRYIADRDAARREEDQAGEAQPILHGAGEVAGMVAAPNPFSKLAAVGRAGRLASAAGQGELYAGGSSRASDAGGVVGDIQKGGGVGLLAGAAAEPVGAAARFFGALKDKGANAAEAATASAAAKDFASERGRLGGVTTGTETDFVTAEKIVASPIAPPDLKARAQAIIDSDMGKETRLRAWENTLDRIPSRLGQIGEARGAMDAAGLATAPAAVAAATKDHLGKSTLMNDVLPRADRLARSAIPGLTPGGAIAQATGAPVTTVNNLLKTPRFQYRTGQVGEAMTKPVAGVAQVGGPIAVRPQIDSSSPGSLLEQFLRQPPMDDEERQSTAAPNFTSKTGGR